MKTREMLQTLFNTSESKVLDEVANVINSLGSHFGINTNLRLAHFLAQVREEIGSKFEPRIESLNYSESSVLKTFKQITSEQAEQYARDEDTPVADQVAIANIVYANRIGNGNADSNGNGKLDKQDDGYMYRGRGTLQITGKYNYQEVQKRIDKYYPNSGVNILTGSNVDSITGSLLIGMGFWIWKDLYKLADAGTSKQVVDSITVVINKYTNSYDHRYNHFKKLVSLL